MRVKWNTVYLPKKRFRSLQSAIHTYTIHILYTIMYYMLQYARYYLVQWEKEEPKRKDLCLSSRNSLKQ